MWLVILLQQLMSPGPKGIRYLPTQSRLLNLPHFGSPLSLFVPHQRASTSIPLNLAEGNGKFTKPDRCRFFDIARGSALECAAALDVLAAKGAAEQSELLPGKEHLREIVSMLVGLIKSNSDYRLHEGDPPFSS
jgi:four helix bundle protein